jgi:hypothetical protein
MAASLFVILARNNRDAVIFRRGPSKQVLLIRWDRKNDTFQIGQWFKGRIYERRCDLSPSGELLVYLAAKHKPPIYSWTAVSRPPYLTALALWPNLGTWGGGGLFESESSLLLNHDASTRELADGFRLPPSMMVHFFSEAGLNEHDSTYHRRLLRDGWRLRQHGVKSEHRTKSGLSWRYEPARIYEKSMSRKKATQFLQMQLRGVAEKEGSWYTLDYELLNANEESRLKLPRIDWADWDSNGDLLFSEKGKLFRLPWSNRREVGCEAAEQIADFSALTFTAKEAPKKALSWDARR